MLATKVALRHSEDRTLLSDLKATYSWLNKNVEDAREALLYAIDIPLFLNVADPLTSEWVGNWEPASNLVLNLPEDIGTWKSVRPFLRGYEELLLSAGCNQLNSLKRTTKRQPSDEILGVGVDLANQFNEMRLEGRLTDLFFEPIIQTAADISSDIKELAAHKAFLAATLPYFRDKFDIEKRGLSDDLISSAADWRIPASDHGVGFTDHLKTFLDRTLPGKLIKSQKFKFEGTRFAAKILLGNVFDNFFTYHILVMVLIFFFRFGLLDFIYTGNFECPAPSDNIKRAELLDDFLRLLSIAEEWDLPSLKDKITMEIVENNRIIEHLPQEFSNSQLPNFSYISKRRKKKYSLIFYSAQSCRAVPC